MNRVITLSRQFGSGGAEIGKKLAEELEIPFYDKHVIEQAAEKSGIAKEHFEKADERRTNSFLFSLVSAHYGGTATPVRLDDIITDDKLFIYTAETVKEMAKRPCLIVGRCADDILRDEDILRVFVYADLPERVKRICELYDLSEKAATTLIKKTDKRRANYYNFYTSRNWGEAANYDICINSARLGVEGTVQALAEFARKAI
ncbi:MAG: cytidylate kinase-like family protein [Clostridia bacterium]|jgi:cytidylate kinase|nr:cytidylate kinase-like family protein [Clostridia bacterium]